MVNVDLLISVGIWFAGIGMSAVGIEMTIHPPVEGTNRKWWYRGAFAGLGLSFIALSVWQLARQTQKENASSNLHQAEQIRNEGNLKYMQGQLDSIKLVLGSISTNSTPQQMATILRNVLPHIDTSEKSALEKMNAKELQTKVIEFANSMREFSARWLQTEQKSSLDVRNKIMTIPDDNDPKKMEIWNEGVQQTNRIQSQFVLDFKVQFLGTAISYRDELLRRLGPQLPEKGMAPPTALDGAIFPARIDETATYLENLARKLPS